MRPYHDGLKRVLDMTVCWTALPLLLPFFLGVALLILMDSKGPVFFEQERLGRKGTRFHLLKFRTMYDRPRMHNREIYGRDAEVTRIGYFLRRLKLDELPQLWNVLKGDMSLVGPRPALPAQALQLDAETIRRLDVRPGLTGLAQISGNIYLPWSERWKYDILYVHTISLRRDIAILLQTFRVIVFGEHAGQAGIQQGNL
ncbi:MAG: hypothetical protein VR64_11545 [Desulfatitalea sp. BRH_c12]|nr:MAG: hypothetical protein VR64_11545 [Desulfatitalea sp. BRH_c12]